MFTNKRKPQFYKSVFLLIAFLISFSFGLNAAVQTYNKTAYFTKFYIRENANDMPRVNYMLIQADGTITPLSFNKYTANNGTYSRWDFDQDKYLGKTINIEFTGTPQQNNQEYPIYVNSTLKLLDRIVVAEVKSISNASSPISVNSKYSYPQADTILIPHDVLVEKESYNDKITTATVNLTDYVTGSGTESDPYISSDNTAGIDAAINALPHGGTILVAPGVYEATKKGTAIPRFVSIKGSDSSNKPTFIFTSGDMWSLKGSNVVENIQVSFGGISASYTGQVIIIDNNARDVLIKNSDFLGNYTVDPNNILSNGNYAESNSSVCFRAMSYLDNIVFDGCSFKNILRSFATKGQRDQNNMIFKNCYFEGSNSMCITFDQVSNIRNVLLESNEFHNFSHFGVAFARITGVKILNNTFYSRNKINYNTYNMAIHIEEHCQNFLIQGNTIDTYLRLADNASENARCSGISVTDSRNISIQNNKVLNSNILFGGSEDIIGYSTIENNTLENGGFQIKEANQHLTIKNNTIKNPAEYAFLFYSVRPMMHNFGYHSVDKNTITGLDNKQAFNIKGKISNTAIGITNNSFSGTNQAASPIILYPGSNKLVIQSNNFYGVESKEKAFDYSDTQTSQLNKIQISNNTYSPNATATKDITFSKNNFVIYQNYGSISIVNKNTNNSDISVEIFDSIGKLIFSKVYNLNKIKISDNKLGKGVFIIKIKQNNKTYNRKVRI